MEANAASQQHAPSYILKAKDWLICLTLVVGVLIASTIMGAALLSTFTGDRLIVLSVAASGIAALAVFTLYLFFTGRTIEYVDYPGYSASALGIGLLVGGVLTVVQALLTVTFVSLGVGEPLGPIGNLVQERGIGLLVSVIVVNLLLVAPGEELLYRNGVQKTLTGSHSHTFAIVGAAGIFTIPHLLNFITSTPVEILVGSFEIFVNGIAYGIAYAYWNRIDVSIIAHGVYNSAVFVFAYLHIFG